MFHAARGKFVVLVALLGLMVSACTSGEPAESPPEESQAHTEPTGSADAEPTASEAVGLPEPEITEITMGFSVTETSQFAEKLAEMEGLYEERCGITVESVTFEGDGLVVQSLVAGQLQAGMIGVSAAVNSQLTDTPLKVVSVNAVILTDQLVAVPDVKSAEDLRGKQVAVSTFGGTSHGAVILSLEGLGLTPDDVVITQIGGQSARIAALEGGAVQAAPIDAALEAEMIEQGFNILIDLKEEALPWGRSGLAFNEEFIDENPNTVLCLTAAALEGQNMMWADPETAAARYAEFTQVDPEEAERLIAEFQEIGNRTMMWEDAAFENPQTVLATVTPEVAEVNTADAFDRSFLDQLMEMGYYEELGIPTE